MPSINITVAEKIATNTTPGVVIVCNNSDYNVNFDLDAEWAAHTDRVARFLYYKNGQSLHQDVEFTGNTVAVPRLCGIEYVLVGVYAGELYTTTPARILCDRSILCGDQNPDVLPPSARKVLQDQIDALKEYTDPLYPVLPFTWERGKYVHGATGAIIENDAFAASSQVDISIYRNSTVKVKCRLAGASGYALYNVNGEYITGESATKNGIASGLYTLAVAIPENAVYIRFTAWDPEDLDLCYIQPVPSCSDVLKAARPRVFPRNVAMFGDSITWGRDGNGASTARTANTIPATVGKILGVNVTNHGVSGMGWLPHNTCPTPIYEKLTTVDLAAYDTITVCLGVNDGFETLGEWNSEDEATIMGQVHKCIKYIYQQNPTARLILIAPFNGRNVGNFPDYWYTDSNSTTYTSRNRLSDALKKACDYYWIPYIDQRNGPINAFTIQTLLGSDGVHPSEEGYQRLGEWLAGEIGRLIG